MLEMDKRAGDFFSSLLHCAGRYCVGGCFFHVRDTGVLETHEHLPLHMKVPQGPDEF